MANSLQSFRVSNQRASLKGFKVEPEKASAGGPVDEPEITVQKAFDYLSNKNPALNDLVSRMDLMEVGNPQLVSKEVLPAVDQPPAQPVVIDQTAKQIPMKVTSKPAIQDAPISPTARGRLSAVATKALSDGISYTYEEVVIAIMQSTDVDQTRAQNGLALMLSELIVLLTPAGTYYLAGTVPF